MEVFLYLEKKTTAFQKLILGCNDDYVCKVKGSLTGSYQKDQEIAFKVLNKCTMKVSV